MAIEIKEYLGAVFNITESKHAPINTLNLKEKATTYLNNISKNSIMVDIEGLHSVLTRNDTLYTDKAMIASEKMWTNPYEIPVIMHHNEDDGITIGRVKHAYWTDKNTRSNTGALRFITNIAHKDGIEGVKNGTLTTVSVGLLADDVRCSICGQNIATHGECEHEKGGYYDGEKCYWIVNSFEPKELSFVIVPSDPYAHIIDIYKPDLNNTKEVKEMYNNPFQEILDESTQALNLAESKKKEEEVKQEEETQTEETKENETTETQEEVETTTEEKPEGEESTQDETKEEENTEDNKEETKEDETAENNEEEAEESEEEKEESKEENKKEIKEEVKSDIEKEKTDIYKNIEIALEATVSENKMLKKEIEELKAKLATEVKLKEAAENKVIEMKTANKKALVEKVVNLRESMNLESEEKESLMKCSEEALNMTIKNLKEFSSKIDVISIPKIKSEVAITESRDNTQKKSTKNVKEHKQDSNISLEGSIVENILSKAFGN